MDKGMVAKILQLVPTAQNHKDTVGEIVKDVNSMYKESLRSCVYDFVLLNPDLNPEDHADPGEGDPAAVCVGKVLGDAAEDVIVDPMVGRSPFESAPWNAHFHQSRHAMQNHLNIAHPIVLQVRDLWVRYQKILLCSVEETFLWRRFEAEEPVELDVFKEWMYSKIEEGRDSLLHGWFNAVLDVFIVAEENNILPQVKTTYTCRHTNIHAYTCIYIYIYIYIYTCTYTHIYVHTLVHIHSALDSFYTYFRPSGLHIC